MSAGDGSARPHLAASCGGTVRRRALGYAAWATAPVG